MMRVRAAAALAIAAGFWMGTMAAARAEAGLQSASPMPDNQSMDGGVLFESYCAPCHGTDGKGRGSVAEALEAAPPDLSTLTRRHGGAYPRSRVEKFVSDGTGELATAHASGKMPQWGPTFRSFDPSISHAKDRIASVVGYVETLQTEIPLVSGRLWHHDLTDALFHVEDVWIRVEPGTDFHRWLSTGIGKRATLTLASDPRRFEDKRNTRILTGTLIHTLVPSELPIVHVVFFKDELVGALSPVTFETDDEIVAARFGHTNNVTTSVIIAIRQ